MGAESTLRSGTARSDTLRAVPMGERALLAYPGDGDLAHPGDGDAVLALYEALASEPLPGQIDLVPGAESLLVIFATAAHRTVAGQRDPAGHRSAAVHCSQVGLATRWRTVSSRGTPTSASHDHAVTIDVIYDGPDLADVAHLTGLAVDGVVAAHTATPWRVAFGGFAPGFAYLTGGDNRLHVPRRDTPRTAVPAGAVGLAGHYSGVYPAASPGGWQLIGRAVAARIDGAPADDNLVELWDVSRDPPALLRPGTTVRFRPVRETVTAATGTVSARPGAARSSDATRTSGVDTTNAGHPALTVVKSGLHCTIQDLGRPGFASMGLGPSGVADRTAAGRANALAGNDPGAPVLEILLGGAEFAALADVTVAVTGAPATVSATSRRDGSAPEATTASYQTVSDSGECCVRLAEGQRLRLGRARTGLRVYLAVAGGIAVPAVLGSCATDTLTGIGPSVMTAGDTLSRGVVHGPTQTRPLPPDTCSRADGPLTLDALAGPQFDWFGPDTVERLAQGWTVSPDSNRTAVRLTGPAITRVVTTELASQGLVRGAMQLPPAGELVAFLADYPVTGGYPVVAVLTEASVDRLAQARPGQQVQVRLISPAD